jgi:hypothetical protein
MNGWKRMNGNEWMEMIEKRTIFFVAMFGIFVLGFVCTLVVFSTAVSAEEFWSVHFATDVRSVHTTVGERITLPIYITNLGLLTDNYKVITTPTGLNPEGIFIEQSPMQTVSIESNKTENVNVFIQTLMQGSRSVRVEVVSDACARKPIDTPECKHIQDVDLSVDYASLPDVDDAAVVQIFMIAVVVMFAVGLKNFRFAKLK